MTDSISLDLFRFVILTTSGWLLLLSVAVKFLRFRENLSQGIRGKKLRQHHPVATLTMIFCLTAFLPFLTFHIGAVAVPPLENACFAGLGILLVTLSTGLHLKSKWDIGGNWSDDIEVFSSHHVVKSGSYALTRHPMYSSLIFWFIGLTILYVNPLVLSFVFIFFVPMMYFRAKAEEQLIEHYVDDRAGYDIYRQRVNMLIPRFGGQFATVFRVLGIFAYGFFIWHYTGSNFPAAGLCFLILLHLLLGFTILPEKAAFSYKSKTGMMILFWFLTFLWQPFYYTQWFFLSMYVYGLFFNCPCMFVYEKYHGCPCFAFLKRACRLNR